MTRILIVICVMTLNVEYQIPLYSLLRLIEIESGYNPNKTSRNRNGTFDYGLMQLNSKYIPDYEWRYNQGKKIKRFNPVVSLRVGMKKLHHLYTILGEWEGAFAAYNCGLSRYNTGKLPLSTQQYLEYIF